MFSEIFHVKLNTNSSSSTSVYAVQNNIGLAVEGLFSVGLLSLVTTSLAGALFSGFPFRSAFSSVIRLNFDILQTFSKWFRSRLSSKKLQWLWIGTVTFFGVALGVAVAYAAFKSIKFILLFFPGAIPIAYSAQHEVVHKP